MLTDCELRLHFIHERSLVAFIKQENDEPFQAHQDVGYTSLLSLP